MGRDLFREILQLTRPAWDYPPAYWRALYILTMWAEEDGQTVITVEFLAELVGVSQRQAATILKELKREGWLTVIEPAHGPASPNVYKVAIPDNWKPPLQPGWWGLTQTNPTKTTK